MATVVASKNNSARTYSRNSRSKDDIVSISLLGEIPVEYEGACRLCLEKADVMVDIFSYNSWVPITVKMRSVTTLEMSEDDELPKLICDPCLTQLNEAYTFKKRCLASDVKLRQFLFNRVVSRTYTYDTEWNTDEGNDEDDLSLVEKSTSQDNNKDSCTINWNDHVPLATTVENVSDRNIVVNLPVEEENIEQTNKDKQEDVALSVIEIEIPLHNESFSETVESTDDVEDQRESHDDATSEEEEEPTPPELLNVNFTSMKNTVKRLLSFPPKTPVYSPRETHTQPKKDQQDAIAETLPITRTLKVVNVEDVPLSLRLLNLEKKKIPEKPGGKNPDTPAIKNIITKVEQTKKKNYMCKKCKCVFKSILEIRKHRDKCRLEFKCLDCNKSFISKSLVQRHMRIHTGERPFQCELCERSFNQKEILVRHKSQKHTAKKAFVCEICKKAYGMYRLLVSHYRLSHDDSRVYSCVHCPKVFRHPSGLSRHQLYHKGIMFECPVCLKVFSDSSSVQRHILQVHPKEYVDHKLKQSLEFAENTSSAIVINKESTQPRTSALLVKNTDGKVIPTITKVPKKSTQLTKNSVEKVIPNTCNQFKESTQLVENSVEEVTPKIKQLTRVSAELAENSGEKVISIIN